MKTLGQIRTLLIEQRQDFLTKDLGIERQKLSEITVYKNTPFAIVISGLRRAGKSTLLAQIANKFYPDMGYFYVNFEDERFLSFDSSNFAELHELLIELFGDQKIFLLDEIQNIDGWERFINRMVTSGYKFYITGSNASLLSMELGTKLTGRYLPVELFPFSFEEYLKFRKIELPRLSRLTTTQRGAARRAFSGYLKNGGIPQALLYPSIPFHKILYDDIINRDVAARYKISDVKTLKELSFYLLSNISALVSYNKLKELLKLGSVNTVSNYIDYLETGWLFFVINQYSYSVKKQQIANKKIYCVDTGLAKSVAFSFSENRGKLLENLVFLKLRRSYSENIYYYKTKKDREIDFYIPNKKIFIQVCQNMTNSETLERETKSLAEAMNEIPGSSGFVLTEGEEDNLSVNNEKISIIPIYKWLLK